MKMYISFLQYVNNDVTSTSNIVNSKCVDDV